jgi:hypothetical protein
MLNRRMDCRIKSGNDGLKIIRDQTLRGEERPSAWQSYSAILHA